MGLTWRSFAGTFQKYILEGAPQQDLLNIHRCGLLNTFVELPRLELERSVFQLPEAVKHCTTFPAWPVSEGRIYGRSQRGAHTEELAGTFQTCTLEGAPSRTS